MMNRQLKKRILMSILGVLISGISVGMFKNAAMGVDPFQSLMGGLNSVFPISFGTLYVIVNAILLLFALLFDRRKIGLATLINLFFLGYVVEFSQKFIAGLLPGPGRAARFLLLAAAVIIMCLASSFYFTADLGVSTYDAVALILSEKQQRVPFRYLRIFTDLICVGAGVLLFFAANGSFQGAGAIAGIGTIITAFFMGPLIEYFRKHVAEPFLAK